MYYPKGTGNLMRRTFLPALVLFFLSPIIAEMLSGSAPPLAWLNPITYILVVSLYGSGALLARELAVRWRSGWPGVILLGAAYGILEEGIDVMSFFNTAWPDLGATATYGRCAGVLWVWAVLLTCYHAAFSIAVPILLTHLVFPRARGERWLGCFGIAFFGGMLAFSVILGNILFRLTYSFSPPPLSYLGSILVIGLLILAARFIRPPAAVPALEKKRLPHPVFYGMAGFFLTVMLFFGGWVLPHTAVPPALTVLAILSPAGLALAVLSASSRHGRQFSDGRKLAMAFGGMMFFIFLSPLHELRGVDAATGKNFHGMCCVGGTAFLLLGLLSLAVGRRKRDAPPS
jgi:hypothetical protein